jgi:hypothetical protein
MRVAKLTRAEQANAAAALISQAGSLVEYMVEMDERLEGIDQDALAEQYARWLRRLPGHEWDLRLPDPANLP